LQVRKLYLVPGTLLDMIHKTHSMAAQKENQHLAVLSRSAQSQLHTVNTMPNW